MSVVIVQSWRLSLARRVALRHAQDEIGGRSVDKDCSEWQWRRHPYVAAIISVVAPLTQAALNPARDFGPRAVSWFLGWGDIAIPGPRGGFFTVYILAPITGAIIGAGLYKALSAMLPASPRNDD